MPAQDEPAIDCHCHVVDPARFPYGADTRYRPAGQEIAPLDTLRRVMARNGVRHALIVGTNSGYGEDLSPVLDALAQDRAMSSGTTFKGVAVVGLAASDATLARLKGAGMAGVAFNAAYHGVEHYAAADGLLRRLAGHGLLLQIQATAEQWPALLPLAEGAGVPVVIDHCGRPAPERGLQQAGFQAVLAAGRAGAVVKLSGYSQFSRVRYPYDDVRPYVEALLDAFTPNRCVWGSDWPFLRAPERIEYAPLLDLVRDLVPDPAARAKILWDTPRRVFGFGA